MHEYVKPERTGKRDIGPHLRHRQWGAACYMTDMDWIEFAYGRTGKPQPVAIFDLKHKCASRNDAKSTQVYIVVADALSIPFWILRYWPDNAGTPLNYHVIPRNKYAADITPEPVYMTEHEFVTEIEYRHLRDEEASDSVIAILSNEVRENW